MQLVSASHTRHLEEAQRIAHVGSWERDILSGELWWSDESCRIMGIEPGTFGGTLDRSAVLRGKGDTIREVDVPAPSESDGSGSLDSQYQRPLREFLATLGWLAGALVVLMASATGAVVLLAARAGLDTHRDTIEVLHMLGSTDVQVARLFQRRIAFDTLLGGVLGTACALVLVWLLQSQFGALGSELMNNALLQRGDWLLLALLPIAFALLATLAARVAVLRAMSKTL